MKTFAPLLLLLALCGAVVYGQSVVAEVTIPANKATVTLPVDPKVAALEARATAVEGRLAKLEKSHAALLAQFEKLKLLQVIPADAAAVSIGSLIQ